MNRKEWMDELSKYLSRLPRADYEDSLNYFEECFDAVGVEGEAKLMQELGSPQDAALEILASLIELPAEYVSDSQGYAESVREVTLSTDGKVKPKRTSVFKVLFIAVLCVLAAPVGIPLTLGTLLGLFVIGVIAFSLLVAFVATGFGFLVAGGAMLIESLGMFASSIPTGLMFFGIALLMIALVLLSVWLVAGVITLVRFIAHKISAWVIRKKEK